jgi:uncharacterized cupin superfamily protein
MGYQHVDPSDIDPSPDRPSVQRAISDAVGLENVAVNRYEAEPGEAIPLAYHYHDEQEELFYVLAGRLVVETPEETYEVSADEVFAVEPDSPQYATAAADADGTTQVLAVGAPRASDAHPYDEAEE